MAVSGIMITILFIAKNSVISGYPLYPLTFIKSGFDWQVPLHLLEGVGKSSNTYIYGIVDKASITEKFISWITIGGTDGLFNILIIILLIAMPFFKQIRQNKRYTAIYAICFIHFVILFFISPQFRFFLPEIVFFLAFIAGEIINLSANKNELYRLAIVIGTIAVLFTLTTFRLRHIYSPEASSAYSSLKFNKIHIGNLPYFSPAKNFFFYGTANGPLPCINERQVKVFEQKYHVVPQMLGAKPEEGFYSKPVAKE